MNPALFSLSCMYCFRVCVLREFPLGKIGLFVSKKIVHGTFQCAEKGYWGHSLKIPEGHLILMAPRVPALNSTHCTALPQYWKVQLEAR